jgi:hypothetical protein
MDGASPELLLNIGSYQSIGEAEEFGRGYKYRI